jgi:hypothetical protein
MTGHCNDFGNPGFPGRSIKAVSIFVKSVCGLQCQSLTSQQALSDEKVKFLLVGASAQAAHG